MVFYMLDIPEFPNYEITRFFTCEDTGIMYCIRDRPDVQVEAPGYLFQFTRMDEPREGELTHFIVSHESVESAIEWFGAKHYRDGAYAKAKFTIERMGVDFMPYRDEPLVIGY